MISSLSVVIPVYNEQAVIHTTLSEVKMYLDTLDLNYELIVVSDGSTDNTTQEVRKHADVILIDNKLNKGKGAAVNIGVIRSTKEYILFMDADHAVDIKNLLNFLPHCETNDIVIASKYIKTDSQYPFHRKVIGKVFSEIRTIVTGLKLKDTQCGFKIYSKDVAKKLFAQSKINGWCFDVEILMLAKIQGMQVIEVAVDVKNSDRVSRINVFSSGTQMLVDLIKLRFNFLRGKYS
jgi:dolichyl-phosphate beta-glucosyltransferase